MHEQHDEQHRNNTKNGTVPIMEPFNGSTFWTIPLLGPFQFKHAAGKKLYRCKNDTCSSTRGVEIDTCKNRKPSRGVVFDTCGRVFYIPEVSFLHHTYISHGGAHFSGAKFDNCRGWP